MPIEEVWLMDRVMGGISTLEERALAVDVGANVGSWTSELSKMFEKVIAIEPDQRASVFMVPRENVTVVEAVAGDSTGSTSLYLRPSPDQNSTLESHPIGAGGMAEAPVVSVAEVKQVTLDELCPAGADFVKIDVEGSEQKVLAGCSADGRWSRTVFVVECHDTKDAVLQELQRLGREADVIQHPLLGAHPGHCWAVTRP